jgi:D-alanyl-lipoteichoic acid acyltransferase DltB (MBOAT superfamily)
MLFNSLSYLLCFLPAVVATYFVLHHLGSPRWLTLGFLVGASIGFYAYWDIDYLPVLVASILANYAISARIARSSQTRTAHRWLTFGVICNLGLLGWFKYSAFAVENLSSLFGLGWRLVLSRKLRQCSTCIRAMVESP